MIILQGERQRVLLPIVDGGDGKRCRLKAVRIAQITEDSRLAWIRSTQGVGREKKIQVNERLRATPDRRAGGHSLYGVASYVIGHLEIVVHRLKRLRKRCPRTQWPGQEQSDTPLHHATVEAPRPV